MIFQPNQDNSHGGNYSVFRRCFFESLARLDCILVHKKAGATIIDTGQCDMKRFKAAAVQIAPDIANGTGSNGAKLRGVWDDLCPEGASLRPS